MLPLLSEYEKLPLLPPFLKQSIDYSNGVYFASGGVGVLPETNQGLVIDLPTQLRNFEEVRKSLEEKLGTKKANELISEAIYFISIGSNDYQMIGKITTKVDVFSFGVVLMELLSGMMALDEDRPEESQYLAAWFWNIKSDKKKLMADIDPTLDINEETFESVAIIAELAGHCTAREPNQRPEMGHAVNVLAPLVEKGKPFDDDPDEYSGID